MLCFSYEYIDFLFVKHLCSKLLFVNYHIPQLKTVVYMQKNVYFFDSW